MCSTFITGRQSHSYVFFLKKIYLNLFSNYVVPMNLSNTVGVLLLGRLELNPQILHIRLNELIVVRF